MHTKRIKLSEEMLIKAIREQHPKGAKALYDMYSASLFGTISRIIVDPHLGEDVLQECFLRIWTSFDQYNPKKGRLYTWMIKIAHNMAVDKIRSKSYRNNQQTLGLDGCEEIPLSFQPILDRIDARLIRNNMGHLRSIEQEIIELIYFKGYTYQEVSEVLSIPIGTVKTNLFQALRKLRVYYAVAG